MAAQDAIRHNKTRLQDILSGGHILVLNKVFENKLITRREYNNLTSINRETAEGYMIILVDKILNKGEDICQAFIRLLQADDDLRETFPGLKTIQWDNSSLSTKRSPSPSPDSAPSNSPKPDLNGSNPAPKPDLNGSNQAPKPDLKRSNPALSPGLSEDGPVQECKTQKEDDRYQLTSTPIGLCVIINNETFENNTLRVGTDMDADSLAKVFSWLGFKVLMCKDQTMDQMDKALKVFASLKALPEGCNVKEWSGGEFTDLKTLPQHGDAFVCCVLSHGLSQAVRGIDRKPLPLDEITSTFNGVNCSALIGKPKVFFIQACQGLRMQRGVMADCAETDLQADARPVLLPVEADMLVAIATVDHYVSFRTKEGSWFIQTLCQELKEGCQRGDDIMAILYRVNDKVSQMEVRSIHGAGKQMPVANVTLRKKVVFSPPGGATPYGMT